METVDIDFVTKMYTKPEDTKYINNFVAQKKKVLKKNKGYK